MDDHNNEQQRLNAEIEKLKHEKNIKYLLDMINRIIKRHPEDVELLALRDVFERAALSCCD